MGFRTTPIQLPAFSRADLLLTTVLQTPPHHGGSGQRECRSAYVVYYNLGSHINRPEKKILAPIDDPSDL